MKMSLISLLLLFFLSHLTILPAQSPFQVLQYGYCFDEKGNYTNTSTYKTNLNTLLSGLTSNTKIDYGFYNSSYGQNPDRVSAIGLCRGDVRPIECRNCLNNATILLLNQCPNQKEVIGGFDECLLRYSNRSILGVMEDDFSILMWNANPNNNIYLDSYVWVLLDRTMNEAATTGDSRRKFAAKDQAGRSSSQTLYAVAQCTPDLSDKACNVCLQTAFSEIPQCCEGRNGGRVIKPSCNIRYESYLFYDPIPTGILPQASPPSPPPSTNMTPSQPQGKGDTGRRTIVMIVVPFVVVVMFCGLVCYFLRRKARKNYRTILKENFGEESSNLESLRFNLATIEVATNNFSHQNKIGKGGFGEVYKGILPNEQEIAVKRLSKSSGQGALEFKNEVVLIAKLQHRNLVTLLGFCLEEQEKILIYEYMPNKSIDGFLFDSEKRKVFNWPERFKILGGIARGLLYLHEHSRLKVIHRDLKPSNILLDNNMNPKISDFGIARMVAIDQDQGSTKIIVGTYGYMAPEYALHGQFSEKSDVFSFGVIMLEIISGKRNSSSHESHSNLLCYAWKQCHDETPLDILDRFLIQSCCQTEVIRCVQIGLLCVQDNPDDRPSMAQIVSYLSNPSVELPIPREPTFFMHGRDNPIRASDSSSGQSSKVSRPSSVNEMSKSEFLPR